MAKAKTKKATKTAVVEPDSSYFLKLVLYLIIGSQWIRLVDPLQTKQIPIPLGLIIGILFASHEHFQIDRKIEYAILLVAMFIGFWFQSGLLITILK
jgi:hypothetical protein